MNKSGNQNELHDGNEGNSGQEQLGDKIVRIFFVGALIFYVVTAIQGLITGRIPFSKIPRVVVQSSLL